MAIDPAMDLSFIAHGDDAGVYYIVQRDPTSTLWWFAESQNGQWANVYRGNLTLQGT
jgi:hypothetical protein